MTRVVEVKDLTAGYLPGVNILNGTNLYADKGELIGIIGPNGAGKTTLFRMIVGEEKPEVQKRGNKKDKKRFLDKIDLMDISFCTTDPRSLAFSKKLNVLYMPNPVDESFEVLRNYENKYFIKKNDPARKSRSNESIQWFLGCYRSKSFNW